VQLLCLIFKDPLNSEYITEKSFKQIHDSLELQLDSIKKFSSSQRSIRMRKTRLNEDSNDEKFYVTQSLVLEALCSILSKNEEAHEYFVKFKTSEVIQNISQNLMIQIELIENETKKLKFLKDMKNCLNLIFDKNLNLPNYIPTLLRLIQYIGVNLLNGSVKSQVTDCLSVILKQLTNITNFNEEMCSIIAAEGGISTIVELLYSTCFNESKQQLYDIKVLCLGLLINLTERNEMNRELLGKKRISSNSQGEGTLILQFLVDLFLDHNTVSFKK
jgi:hypothetical protein